jgi:hypothetical protein
MLLVFLAFAYVVVGVAGEISCAEETLAAASSLGASAAGTEKSDTRSTKAPEVVEHCYTCIPLLLPAPVVVAAPPAEPAKLAFDEALFVLEDHPGLDTPPPKHRTRES